MTSVAVPLTVPVGVGVGVIVPVSVGVGDVVIVNKLAEGVAELETAGLSGPLSSSFLTSTIMTSPIIAIIKARNITPITANVIIFLLLRLAN